MDNTADWLPSRFGLVDKSKNSAETHSGSSKTVNLEIAKDGIYGVDFAVKKDRSVSPPKYLVFFKGRDADALTAAFREYTAKEVSRASKEKPSVLEHLRSIKAKLLTLTQDKSRQKDKELER